MTLPSSAPTMRMHAPRARVRSDRLLADLAALARIGATPEGGVTRPAFSAADREAVSWLRHRCLDVGLCSEVDPAGNLLVRRPSDPLDRPAVLLGSHLDTVPQGGRLDGAYGVLAAVEVLRRLHETGADCPYPPVAVAFANEEGALFPQPFWGSRALIGDPVPPAEPVDVRGRPLREALRLVGGDLDRIGEARWEPDRLAAFLELHIEQGPMLEREGVPIGVVDGIVGRIVLDVRLIGVAGHAGTTPTADRRDALLAAADVVLMVRDVADRGGCARATVGRLEVVPNGTNVIAGEVRLAVELRDLDGKVLDQAACEVQARIEEVAAERAVAPMVQTTVHVAPQRTDPALAALVRRCADGLGLTYRSIASGAGHDAQILATRAPAGMIFVPSREGLSHHPAEDTADEDLVAGADLLLATVIAIEAGADGYRPSRRDGDGGELCSHP